MEGVTQPILADAFHLSPQCIQNICSGKRAFKHLKPIDRENGAAAGRRMLSDEQVDEIREARRSGETLRAIGERHDVNQKLVWTVVHERGLYAEV